LERNKISLRAGGEPPEESLSKKKERGGYMTCKKGKRKTSRKRPKDTS